MKKQSTFQRITTAQKNWRKFRKMELAAYNRGDSKKAEKYRLLSYQSAEKVCELMEGYQ